MRGPIRKRVFSALFFVSLLVLTVLSAQPTAAFHDTAFSPPQQSMKVRFALDHWTFNATFGDAFFGEEQLAGYLQERRVLPIEVESGDWVEEYVFDQQTGHQLGYRYIYGHTRPFVSILPEGLVDAVDENDRFSSPAIGLSWLFPESVLWGRPLQGGESWEVIGYSEYCEALDETVAVAEDATEVVVSSVCARGDAVLTTRWTLTNPSGSSPFGSERILEHIRETDGVVTSHTNRSVPVEIVDAGGWRFPFGGTERFVVDERDQTFRYGALSLIPYDPEPLASFDVAAAARAALETDGAALRAFFAQADAPRLVSASVGHEPELENVGSWRLWFADANDRSVQVSFLGVRTDDGMIVHDARSYTGYGWPIPEGSDEPIFAAPGDVARATVQVLEEKGLRVERLSWTVIDRFDVFSATGQGPCDQIEGDSLSVGVDLTMGTVRYVGDDDNRISTVLGEPYQPLRPIQGCLAF